jgi:hypothetical protein
MIDIPGQGPLGPATEPQPEPINLPNPGPFVPQTNPPGQDLPLPAEPVQTPSM